MRWRSNKYKQCRDYCAVTAQGCKGKKTEKSGQADANENFGWLGVNLIVPQGRRKSEGTANRCVLKSSDVSMQSENFVVSERGKNSVASVLSEIFGYFGASRERKKKNMFLHAGENVTVRKKDIIGIFDIDNTVTPKATKEFLQKAQVQGEITSAGCDLPKSFVLTCDGKKKNGQKVIFSHISAKTLAGRAEIPLT